MLTEHHRCFKCVVLWTTASFLFGFGGCLPENYFGQISTSASTGIADAVTLIMADRVVNALFGQVSGTAADVSAADQEEDEEQGVDAPNPEDEPPPFP